jgi:glycosyltransferase involved in cell wall biosynthesis
MLRNRIYYRLKPFIPQSLRTAIRRRIALRLRGPVGDIWPIWRGSEQSPKDWPGWPEGKKFALVLTHDVEGAAGLRKCRELMSLEIGLGFRSSFNFIPEARYKVPPDLREELTRNGFEVGIHDLRHDGRLFASRDGFRRNAARINSYLHEWGAAGFRSGFMLHKLDWLHDLGIQYDASTFDTDPFEPQPEGRHTIFPFWVPAPENQRSDPPEDGFAVAKVRSKIRRGEGQLTDPSSDFRHSAFDSRHAAGEAGGYVELPYTLPQDSTIFTLLGEKTTHIWQRKLDWIAEHGGMALLITHPDYMDFAVRPQGKAGQYPAALYQELLEYIESKYSGQYWLALPKEMAAFVAGLRNLPTNRRPKRVAMISHSVYMSDNRVRRYAEALSARGDQVDVFALRRQQEIAKEETIEGVRVFRIQDRFLKNERSKLAYLWPLLRFLVVASARLSGRHLRRPYDIIHVHNIPDFLVFAAWYPRLTGVPVILDIHDVVPEFFTSKFRVGSASIAKKILMWMERVSAAFADQVIIANHLWLEKYAQRTGLNGRCTVFINHVDSKLFKSVPRTHRNGRQVVLYPGGLQWHQGLDIALRAFKQVAKDLPTVEFHIYGDGSAKESLVELADELGLNGRVRFFEPTTVREIASIMAGADLGVVPKRADSFGNEAYSTKIMEFMAVGVPVIVSNTKVDRYYFNESVVSFFNSGDADDLARRMIELLRDADLRKGLANRGCEYAAANCWEGRKDDYLRLVDCLCASGGKIPQVRGGQDHERCAS